MYFRNKRCNGVFHCETRVLILLTDRLFRLQPLARGSYWPSVLWINPREHLVNRAPRHCGERNKILFFTSSPLYK